MKTSQPPKQRVEVGWGCSLHHLPAFVIVPYYCPYFSSAVSCSLLLVSPHRVRHCYVHAWIKAVLTEWQAAWAASRLGLAFCYFPQIRCWKDESMHCWIMHGGKISFVINSWNCESWDNISRQIGQSSSALFYEPSCSTPPHNKIKYADSIFVGYFLTSQGHSCLLPPSHHCIISTILAGSAVTHHISSRSHYSGLNQW